MVDVIKKPAMKPLHKVPFCLLVAESCGENRFQTFFMMGAMMSDHNRKGAIGNSRRGSHESEGRSCADPSDVASLQDQLSVALKGQQASESEKESIMSRLAELQTKVDTLLVEQQEKENDLCRAGKPRQLREDMPDDEPERPSMSDREFWKGRKEVFQSQAEEKSTEDLSSPKEKTKSVERDKIALRADLKSNSNEINEQHKSNTWVRHGDATEACADLQKEYLSLHKKCGEAVEVQDQAADIAGKIQACLSFEARKVELAVEEKWKSDLTQLAKSSRRKLEEVALKAKGMQARQQAALDQQVMDMRATQAHEIQALGELHSNEVESLRMAIDEISEGYKKMEMEKAGAIESLRDLERKLRETREESRYWESAFRDRSAFNLTHVVSSAHDVIDVLLTISTSAIAPTCEYWVSVYESSIKSLYGSVKPSVKKVYKQHIRPHWDAIYYGRIECHMNEIKDVISSVVMPAVSTVKEKSQSALDDAHKKLGRSIKHACLRSNGFHDVIDRLGRCCDNPERGIESIFSLSLAFFVFLVGATILRITARTVLWVSLLAPRGIVSILSTPSSDKPLSGNSAELKEKVTMT